MKAMLWKGLDDLEYIDLPEPECKPGWVKIKVMAVGLCATEVHIITGKFYGGEPPHVLGHEICGQIVDVGEQDYVVGVEPGTYIPLGRAVARERGELATMAPQESREFNITLSVENI